jgi:hypothetical protein
MFRVWVPFASIVQVRGGNNRQAARLSIQKETATEAWIKAAL